jgi:hypothetical protein
MKNGRKFLAVASALVLAGSVSVMCATSVMARNSSTTASKTTTTEQTTEETTETTTKKSKTETTTKKSGNTFTAKEATTEATTKTKVTTTETTTETPTDAQGNKLTGNDLKAWQAVANTYKDKWATKVDVKPVDETVLSEYDHSVDKRSFKFDNNDVFELYRYSFNITDYEVVTVTQETTTTVEGSTETTTQETTEPETKVVYKRLTDSFTIPGNTIEIRYKDPSASEWYMSQNPENTQKQLLFIDTDSYHMIISVPAVYSTTYTNNTLEYHPDLEEKINIENLGGSYKISYSFPIDKEKIGEIWMLKSTEALANWNDATHFSTMSQDLAVARRFSKDGYYFPVPSSYYPYSETMLYRHPSDYAGTSFARYGSFNAAKELGYVFVWTCMQNQNEKGYWATGPKSDWLVKDFKIGAGFYDTRFNTDFAQSLLYAYKRYNNTDFLYAACKYAQYFIDHAENNHYETKNGGYLVQDYGYDYDHNDTHVSLNHQLAELNYLYNLYEITKNEDYKELADKMLLAIDDTRDQWVLPSGDLNYALYYSSDTNTMVDYPYLTYNDLFTTKQILKNQFKTTNATVEYLMASKKAWMDANNVTGYYTE